MRIPFALPLPGDRSFDLVGLGLNSVDLLTVVAEYPAADSKHRIQQFARLPGGQTATALVACSRLGWRTRYIGSFGADELGHLSRNSLIQEGIDVTATRVVEGATNQFALILVDARTGERTVLWDRHPALALQEGDVPAAAVTSGRMLLVDAQELTASTEAARAARQSGIPTMIDVETVAPGLGDLLRHIDAIVTAQEFPTRLTGYEDLGRALDAMGREFNAPLACVTLGRQGSLAWVGGREIRTPAFEVECVDTTGAGDIFRGAFAAACLRAPDGQIEDVLRYANAVAALNCRALGARGAIPTPGEVEQFLMRRP